MTDTQRAAADRPAAEEPVTPGTAYFLASLLVLLAFLLRVALFEWLDPTFLLFYAAVVVAALAGGRGPGLLATALAGLLTAAWIIPASRPPGPPTAREVVTLFVSLLLCGMLSVVADGFRRSRRAEAATRQALHRLARHVGNTPLAVVEWDADFRVSAVNHRAEALFGWSAEELVGKRLAEIPWVPPEAQASVDRVVQDMARGTRSSNVNANRNLRKDGTPVECEWYNSALHDGEGRLVSVLSLVLDVTARERAEAALRESRTQLALFVRHAPAAIAMFDRELRYLAASDRYLSDYRLGAVEVLGRSHYEIFPEIPERWKEIHQRCLAGAVERCEAEPFPRADGRTDWVRWEIRPWHDREGRVGGLLLFSEVVTRLREVERRAARGERLEAVATLVRGMSHEINSPLASVITNVDFARRGLQAAPPPARAAWDRAVHQPLEDLDEALADAAAGAARVKAIVRDMAGFLPHPGTSTLRASPRAAVEKALRLAHHELVPCAAVVTDLAETPDVALDEDDLVQVLASLLVNAGQATGAAANRVTVTVRPAGPDAVQVEVVDTGVGMDAATLAHVFEPFFTTRPLGRAKGLGVPRCRVVVEAVGGELGYRSAPGRGTTATLVLPLAPSGAAAADRAPTGAAGG